MRRPKNLKSQAQKSRSHSLRMRFASSRMRTFLPLIIVFILVGGLGAILLLKSHAATFVTSVEAENGTLSSNAAIISDSNASGGKAVRFGLPSSSSPCGQNVAPPAQYDHVIWITFENYSYAHYLSNTNLPYIHSIAAQCGSATNFYGETEPSLPNYLAMVSGDTQGFTGSDANPHNPGNLTADNIFNQVKQSGRQWRSYAESMPSNCYHTDYPNSSSAVFTAHHEAASYFADIASDCSNWMVPQGTTTSGAMITDINANNLPAFAIVGPNDDGGCSSCGGDVDPQKLDGYLQGWLPKIFATPSYKAGKTAIFLTWDEDDIFEGGSASNGKDHIPTIVIAPTIPAGTTSAAAFTHYSMLRSTEEMLGINTFLGNAATANDMRSAFHM